MMKKVFLCSCILILSIALNHKVVASSLVGGNFELLSNGVNGRFVLKLHLYYDKSSGRPSANDDNLKVGIFQKSNNQLKQSLTLTASSLVGNELTYKNDDCANSQNLKVIAVDYEANLLLPPSDFTDPAGYYIALDKCCRASVSNISNPTTTGALVYLAFPALLQNSADFINSSPKFKAPSGEYICKGQAFSYDCGATDADGDILSYQLVTPYSGSSTSSNPNPTPTGTSGFPTVTWTGGVDATTAIPGNPALTINNAGIISVTATTLGSFLFSVEVTETRNGVVIGKVRRDFAFKVIDCTAAAPPVATIFDDYSTTPVSTANVCENGFVQLSTTNNSNYSYQWQKNGLDVLGATTYDFKAEGAGTYTVQVSAKTGCSKASTSSPTTLTQIAGEDLTIDLNYTNNCGQFTLIVVRTDGMPFTNASRFVYRWSNGIVNVALRASNTPANAGDYSVIMTPTSPSSCKYIIRKTIPYSPAPNATITTSNGTNEFCVGSPFKLSGNLGGDYNYEWTRNFSVVQNGINHELNVTTSGTYSLKISNRVGCTATSTPLTITSKNITPVTFGAIPPVCTDGSQQINLSQYITPFDATNGVLSARSINISSTIDSKDFGVGTFPITYTFNNPNGCKSTATSNLLIDIAPRVTLGNDVLLENGQSVQLSSTLANTNLSNFTLAWSPASSLSSTNTPSTMASPTTTTTYTLKVTNNTSGCSKTDDVVVFVTKKIANSFTPNEDGLNDFWDLSDLITDHPNAYVRIFNRWGNQVFSTRNYTTDPFKGIIDDYQLKTSTYYYIIELREDWPSMTGYLTVVR